MIWIPMSNLIVVVRNPVTRALSDLFLRTPPNVPTCPNSSIWLLEMINFRYNSTFSVSISFKIPRIFLDRLNSSTLGRDSNRNLRTLLAQMASLLSTGKFPTSCRWSSRYGALRRGGSSGEVFGPRAWNSTVHVRLPRKSLSCLVDPSTTTPHCLGKTKGRPHPHVDDDNLNLLARFYEPFNQLFYQLVGRNFVGDYSQLQKYLCSILSVLLFIFAFHVNRNSGFFRQLFFLLLFHGTCFGLMYIRSISIINDYHTP